MSKLSKKQIEVIKRMREGASVWYITGLDIHGCMSEKNKSETLSIATIFALEKNKYIERDESDWRSVEYNLTELGKTCLLEN